MTGTENHFYVSGLFAVGSFFVWLRKQGGVDTVRYIPGQRRAVSAGIVSAEAPGRVLKQTGE
ncbi:MAG: hypothetical protein E6X49_06725 [Leclercia adecarboxylata]|nr:hypothetical protein [Leclercia adecarboxylata]